MKNEFNKILFLLKSTLKNKNIESTLVSNYYDKSLYNKVLITIDKYYDNINLLDNIDENLLELITNNARQLLKITQENTFNVYVEQFRKISNFLIDNSNFLYKERIKTSKDIDKEDVQIINNISDKNYIEIPYLEFKNLPEKRIDFSDWKEISYWAKNEVKQWEHWYDYIPDMTTEVKRAIEVQRGATIRLWSNSQQLTNSADEKSIRRFSRMAVKNIKEVNDSNPIISYSKFGKEMIDAMDNDPNNAIKKYSEFFLQNSNEDKNNTKKEIDILSLGKFKVKKRKVELFNKTFSNYGSDLENMIFDFISVNALTEPTIKFRINFYNTETGFNDSITKEISKEKLKWFNDFFEEIKDSNRVVEKKAIDSAVDYLTINGVESDFIRVEKMLFNTKHRPDIAVEYQNKILFIVELKKVLNLNAVSLNDKIIHQLDAYYNTITQNQKNIPKVYVIFHTSKISDLYEYYTKTQTIKKVKHFQYDEIKNEHLHSISSEKINNELDNSLQSNHENKSFKYNLPQNSIAHFNNDTTKNQDYLEITKDVDAFAKLITYKGLKTPLSIGLFGKWGSGKSFFMEELEKKIESYSEDKEGTNDNTTFCKNVISIDFNAWHYSDTELWASLVNRIFKKIDDKINPKVNQNSERIETLYSELKRNKQLIDSKKVEFSILNSQIEEFSIKIGDIENKLNSEVLVHNEINVKEVFNKVLSNVDIKNKIKKIKDDNIIDEVSLENVKNIHQELNELFGMIKYSVKLFKKNLKWFLLIFAILITALSLNTLDLKFEFIKELSNIIYFGILIPIGKIYKENISPYKNIFKDILNFQKQKEAEEREKIALENMEIQKKRLYLYDELKKLENSKSELEQKNDNILRDIEDIKNGKSFKEFIFNRVNSEDYTKHLGLISTVREDLEELETYLKDEKDIDRIVLYIDDLDRCSNDLVVDVLEAVHLLLAFNLFVVVVGIDSRWIIGALEERHNNFKISDESEENKITPIQYIEKIFQIPFKIKSLNEDDKKKMVSKLLNKVDVLEDNNSKREKEDRDEEEKNTPQEYNNSEVTNASLQDNKIIVEQNIHERLKLASEEIQYIEEMSSILGETPRTIKRFINIYMIIRSHEDIHKILTDDLKNHKIIILLLSKILYLEDSNKKEADFKNKLEKIDKLDDYNSNNEVKENIEDFISRFSFI